LFFFIDFATGNPFFSCTQWGLKGEAMMSHLNNGVQAGKFVLSACFVFMFMMVLSLKGSAAISFDQVGALSHVANVNNYDISIATNGAGLWVAVWDAEGGSVSPAGDIQATGPDGKNEDLYFARSVDNGLTWSSPALLRTDAAADDGDDISCRIATDRKHNWVVVWRTRDSLGGATDQSDDIAVTYSTDDGLTWSAPKPLNKDAAYDESINFGPDISTDGQGHWVATWTQSYGPQTTKIKAAYSSDHGANWSDPIILQQYGGWSPPSTRIATDNKGRWIATWESYSFQGVNYLDWDILYAVSDNNGQTWTSPARLNNDAVSDNKDDRNPSIARDGAGNWVVIWTASGDINISHDPKHILCSRSTDNGNTWSGPAVLNSNDANSVGLKYYPEIITDGEGTWLAAWSETVESTLFHGVHRTVSYAISTNLGATWSPQQAVGNPACLDAVNNCGTFQPMLVCDGLGRWLLAWNTTLDPATGNITNTSRNLFSMSRPISIFSLAGEEYVMGGSPFYLHWTSDVSISGTDVRIELWNSAGKVADIDCDTSPLGDKTSLLDMPMVPSGPDYRIRIVSLKDPGFFAETEQPFTIYSFLLCFDYPHGNVVWPVGSTQKIFLECKAHAIGGNINLELWRNGTQAGSLGHLNQGDTNKWFSIRIPQVPTGVGYTIHAYSAKDPSIFGDSYGYINIAPRGAKSSNNY